MGEKKAVSNASSNFAPASPELNASVSAGEESYPKKRKISADRSPSPDADSRPSTPKSTGLGMSTGSKIKLKIKIGADDNDSGSEVIPITTADPLGLEDDATSAKKMKKKKKKKHRHKDKERKDRGPSNRDPLALEGHSTESYDNRDHHFNSANRKSGIFSKSVTEVMKDEEEDSDISDV